ncbi:MAG: GSCFA domain-containing protein [Saprospiraceae bacterium]|nr:GSCFA domain-containing protein [Saprospiraceae bacterium]
MDLFRTTTPNIKFPFHLNHENRVLSIGSCFSDHIGSRLINYKFECLLNPFGILYNPISIGKNLTMALDGYQFSEQDVFRYEDHWHSYNHPGRFSRPNQADLLKGLQTTSEAVNQYLDGTNRILCTLGSSMVYVNEEFGEVVANCHKLPADRFSRYRLSIEEVVESLRNPFQRIKAQNPDLEIVLTVSPVRHIRDGMHVNQKSKAVLLLAIEALSKLLPYVHYFPAYEIQLDDLRDYRFYNSDMLHPNETAINYIWNHVEQALFANETQALNKQLRQILAAVHHRPLRPESPEHQAFIHTTLEKINRLETDHPKISLEKERGILRQALVD